MSNIKKSIKGLVVTGAAVAAIQIDTGSYVVYDATTQEISTTNVVKASLYDAMDFKSNVIVEPNIEFKAFSGCSIPPPPGQEPSPEPMPTPQPGTQVYDWGVEKIGIKEAHKTTKGQGIKVAVLDTGVESNHPDLKPPTVGVNFSGGNQQDFGDRAGHGTHVYGLINAQQNEYGVVGTCPDCQMYVAKVLADNGSGSLEGIANGIIWAANQGVHVINMSLGAPQYSQILEQAVRYAKSKGVQVIAARGNNGNNFPNYPANLPGVISVGASIYTEALAQFSSYPGVYTAPGSGTKSTCIHGSYCDMSGTSMASPILAGVCALHLSVGFKTCDDLSVVQAPNAYRPETHGKGRVDAIRSVTLGIARAKEYLNQ